MNKIFYLFFILFIIYNNTLLCSNDLILELKKQISNLNNLKKLVKLKERQLNNLKISGSKNVWNFFDRKNNESVIMVRNRLLKELNSLNIKINDIESNLILKRNFLIEKIDDMILNKEYLELLNYIDDLYYDNLIKNQPSNEKIVDIELQHERNLKINEYLLKIKKFIDYLNVKINLISKYHINYDINNIKKQINNLENQYKLIK